MFISSSSSRSIYLYKCIFNSLKSRLAVMISSLKTIHVIISSSQIQNARQSRHPFHFQPHTYSHVSNQIIAYADAAANFFSLLAFKSETAALIASSAKHGTMKLHRRQLQMRGNIL